MAGKTGSYSGDQWKCRGCQPIQQSLFGSDSCGNASDRQYRGHLGEGDFWKEICLSHYDAGIFPLEQGTGKWKNSYGGICLSGKGIKCP